MSGYEEVLHARLAALEVEYDDLHDRVIRVCNEAATEGNHIGGVSVVSVARVLDAVVGKRTRPLPFGPKDKR